MCDQCSLRFGGTSEYAARLVDSAAERLKIGVGAVCKFGVLHQNERSDPFVSIGCADNGGAVQERRYSVVGVVIGKQ